MALNPFSIRFDQRKSDNSAYKEKFVSGSNLILITDNIGEVAGTREITASGASIGSLFVTGVGKLFDIVYAYTGVIGNVTGSLSGSTVTANTITANQITGTLYGTASNAATASYVPSGSNFDITVTYATSSTTSITSSYLSGSTAIAESASFLNLVLNFTASAPLSSTSSGLAGEVRMDNNFLYIYTGNYWKRYPVSVW